MGRSVLVQALHLPFVILDQLFAMSKGFVIFTFELMLIGIALFGNSARSTYVDRQTRADMFRILPRNASSDCLAKGATCATRGKLSDDQICAARNCCFCRCDGRTRPTYLLHKQQCVEENELLQILQSQANEQGCLYRSIVGAGSKSPKCSDQQKVLVTVDTTKGARNYSMKICSWKTSSHVIHEVVSKNITNCTIIPSESFYLFNGTWLKMWAPGMAKSQSVFKVYLEGKNTGDAKILLEWLKDLPAVYAGLIFSLKLRCYKSDQVINSCLFSKNRGVFNGSKPPFYPPTTLRSSTVSTRSKTAASPTVLTEPSVNVSVLEPNPGGEEKELDVLVLVLVVVGALLVFVLLCVSLLLIIRRRRRGDIDKFKPRENPVYQKGPSISLKVNDIEDEEETQTGLPLIINHESRDQPNGAPASHRKSKRAPDPKAPPSPDPHTYQSLREECITGGDYQELLDDAQVADTVLEDGHEYHVLESDGGASDSGNSSYSMETPPAQRAEKNSRGDLLDDAHDYDEPDTTGDERRDTTLVESRSIGNESARLAGYDEPETMMSDGGCTESTSGQAHGRLDNLSDAHDYAEPDI